MLDARALTLAVVVGALGCASTTGTPPQPPRTPVTLPPAKARAAFDDLLERFADHDQQRDWNAASCEELGKGFQRLAERSHGQARASAYFNAGLTFQRCAMHEQARAAFQKSDSHHARAELALYELRAGTASLDVTIQRLHHIIRQAHFQNLGALVSLATLQMRRAAQRPSSSKADLDAAKKNLQRALAIDDAYVPAMNQLALYYLSRARLEAGSPPPGGDRGLILAASEPTRAHRQQVDLAALVASQAIAKNDRYAPIHNTAGLIQVELADYNSAVQSFRRARELDPDFFEAHHNYAAVSLAFRGFEQAEAAYRDALRLRPDDYESLVGLALALRGQANLDDDATLDQARAALAHAKRVAPKRAEAYYNEAILVEEFLAKRAQGEQMRAELKHARKLLSEFLARAGNEAHYASATKRARMRAEDIQTKLDFLP